MPPELRAQALALQEQAWPSEPGEVGDPSHDPTLSPYSLPLDDGGGTVLAALDVLTKELDHDGERWLASGLSRVVTDRTRLR
ncbi:hypothetical protein ABIA32_001575 [Streptacidiphilus sp. MAP12-20]|uniref:hypothetical protein n=1 Tax=Streptacidiphilus sp. MAP12-20 TaxID=3156299 RepID=UPI0035137E29